MEDNRISYFHGALAETFPVTCGEAACAEKIKELLAPSGAEVLIDAMGNVIARKTAKRTDGEVPKKRLYCANIDVPGFTVLGVEENGRVNIAKLGELDVGNILYSTVFFTNDTKVCAEGKVFKSGGDDAASFYAETGITDKSKLEDKVRCGGSAAIKSGMTFFADGSIYGLGAANLMCAAVLIDMFLCMDAGKCGCDLYALFAVQSNLRARGFEAAVNAVRPDEVILITHSHGDKKLGKVSDGAKLIMKYRSGFACEELTGELSRAAGGTLGVCVSDLDGLELGMAVRAGARFAAVCVPSANCGSFGETVNLKDGDAVRKICGN